MYTGIPGAIHWEIQKPADWNSSRGVNKKITPKSMEAETYSDYKLHTPSTVPYNLEATLNSQLLSGSKVLEHTPGSLLSKLPERRPPGTPSLKVDKPTPDVCCLSAVSNSFTASLIVARQSTSIQRVFQERILEQVATSQRSSQETQEMNSCSWVSHTGRQILHTVPPGSPTPAFRNLMLFCKEAVLKRNTSACNIYCHKARHRESWQALHLPGFPWKDLTAALQAAAWGFSF